MVMKFNRANMIDILLSCSLLVLSVSPTDRLNCDRTKHWAPNCIVNLVHLVMLPVLITPYTGSADKYAPAIFSQ